MPTTLTVGRCVAVFIGLGTFVNLLLSDVESAFVAPDALVSAALAAGAGLPHGTRGADARIRIRTGVRRVHGGRVLQFRPGRGWSRSPRTRTDQHGHDRDLLLAHRPACSEQSPRPTTRHPLPPLSASRRTDGWWCTVITLEAATLAAQEFGSRNLPENHGLQWAATRLRAAPHDTRRPHPGSDAGRPGHMRPTRRCCPVWSLRETRI